MLVFDINSYFSDVSQQLIKIENFVLVQRYCSTMVDEEIASLKCVLSSPIFARYNGVTLERALLVVH